MMSFFQNPTNKPNLVSWIELITAKANIDVYVKNDLYIRFDILLQNGQIDKINKISSLANLEKVATQFADQGLNICDSIVKNKQIYTKKIMKHILQISPRNSWEENYLLGDKQIKKISLENSLFKHVTITYKFSAIPHAFINWFACFSIFVFVKGNVLNHIQFDDHQKFELLNLALKSSELFNQKNYQLDSHLTMESKMLPVLKIMEKIIEIKKTRTNELIAYNNALESFEQIYNYYISQKDNHNSISYLSTNIPFIQFLSDVTRSKLVYKEQISILSDMSLAEKEEYILEMTIKSHDLNNKNEFIFMLDTLNARNKLKLLNPCLKMLPHHYTMCSTELLLIYFAEFQFLEDGRLAIINLDKNPIYLEYYAIKKMNYHIFNSKLTNLAQCLKWDLEPGNNAHDSKKIIFTYECTKTLSQLGLYLNSQFSKNLFNIYQFWAFMTKIRLAGNNVFSMLSQDVFDLILSRSQPSHYKFFHGHFHSTFFKAAELGKLKGKLLHTEFDSKKQLGLRK